MLFFNAHVSHPDEQRAKHSVVYPVSFTSQMTFA